MLGEYLCVRCEEEAAPNGPSTRQSHRILKHWNSDCWIGCYSAALLSLHPHPPPPPLHLGEYPEVPIICLSFLKQPSFAHGGRQRLSESAPSIHHPLVCAHSQRPMYLRIFSNTFMNTFETLGSFPTSQVVQDLKNTFVHLV